MALTILSILLGLLPGFAWLFFYLQEDTHKEPPRLIFKTFVFGAIAAGLALFAEMLFNSYVPNRSPDLLIAVFSLVGLSFIEEIFKFSAARLSVKNSPAFSEPIDAMIYALVASLGFATLENIGAIASNFLEPSGTATISSVFQIVSFRFVGATLLHALTGAIVGYYWALSIREFGRTRLLVKGLILATFLHAVFNFLILSFESYLQPIVFVMIVGFFVLADFEKFKDKKV